MAPACRHEHGTAARMKDLGSEADLEESFSPLER
jgi:hypothetical protein